MTLELTAVPLALLAGALSILSPCVWPLVPIVMGSAATSGRSGPWALALGLSLAFALAGTLLSFLLVNTGLDPELFRYLAAILLVAVALPLIHQATGAWLTGRISRWTARFEATTSTGSTGTHWSGQFGVGLLLGLVWLPCVGPTLGAAIGLASMGQQMGTAFIVMFSFGLGTAVMLLLAGLLSGGLLKAWRPHLMASAGTGKRVLGWTLLGLDLLVLIDLDKQLEAWALGWLPAWAFSL